MVWRFRALECSVLIVAFTMAWIGDDSPEDMWSQGAGLTQQRISRLL